MVSVPKPDGSGGAGSSPSPGSVQATFVATLVDEWVRAGLTEAVVCPGSRSTPLALALAARPELELHVRLDERGAGFFAVGLGLATGRPAVVSVTSGTAAAELHASVLEADASRVPMLVCTADRPPELHDVGAAQTIDQHRLFGAATRFFAEPGVPDGTTRATWRSLGARLIAETTEGPLGPGPVHVNLAFREPLLGEVEQLPPGRPGGLPWHRVARPATMSLQLGVEVDLAGRRGILVVGAGGGPPERVLALAERLGWPVLADPRSGCRLPHPNVVAAADAILRSETAATALSPEVVVLLGERWASKVLAGFLSSASRGGAEVLVVDPWWRWSDPDRQADSLIVASAEAWLDTVLEAPATGGADPSWLERWQRCERAAQAAIGAELVEEAGPEEGLSEPAISRALLGALPPTATVLVASSMPVRDIEWFTPALAASPRVLSNRGVNGIDGVSSTAQGVAAANPGPVVGLLGDLAFLHDASSLVQGATAEQAGSCTLVVVDNGGGAIFEFLPQAAALPESTFERLFGTPQRTDVAAVARGFGLVVREAHNAEELLAGLHELVGSKGLSVLRVVARPRPSNVATHDRIHARVAERVGALFGHPDPESN